MVIEQLPVRTGHEQIPGISLSDRQSNYSESDRYYNPDYDFAEMIRTNWGDEGK